MSASRAVNARSRGASRSRVSQRTHRVDISAIFKNTITAMFFMTAFGLSGYGIYWLLPKLNWPVENVVLEGDFNWLDQSAVHKAITENLDGDLFSIDIKKLRAEIRQVPWVEDAEINRVYPDSLIVQVKEERPVAQWNDQGYISSLGEFIESPVYAELSGLPQLSSSLRGVDAQTGAREAIEIYHLLNSAVLVSGESVEMLSQNSSGGWIMVWDSGLEIDLGRSDHLKRVRHALAAWRRLPAAERQTVGEIDARYDNGVAIRARRAQKEEEQMANENEPASKSSSTKPDNPA
jgi:cell division protein FtsQ